MSLASSLGPGGRTRATTLTALGAFSFSLSAMESAEASHTCAVLIIHAVDETRDKDEFNL